MITKKLKKKGNDLYFICFSCKKNTFIRNVADILDKPEEMEKLPRLKKTSKTAPLGTSKTFLSAVALSLITAIWVGNLIDMPPFLVIISFGFLFEYIINPTLLHFFGNHQPIWIHFCENCNTSWQVVADRDFMLLVFRFLF